MTPARVPTGLLALVGPSPGAAADEAKVLRIVKQPGLGYLQLIVMRELPNTDLVVAGLLTVILIGVRVESLLFRRIERKTVLRWGRSRG